MKNYPKGLYAHRTDDRGGHHRHSRRDRDPGLSDYTIRSQVTEGLNLASACKASVSEYFQADRRLPDRH